MESLKRSFARTIALFTILFFCTGVSSCKAEYADGSVSAFSGVFANHTDRDTSGWRFQFLGVCWSRGPFKPTECGSRTVYSTSTSPDHFHVKEFKIPGDGDYYRLYVSPSPDVADIFVTTIDPAETQLPGFGISLWTIQDAALTYVLKDGRSAAAWIEANASGSLEYEVRVFQVLPDGTLGEEIWQTWSWTQGDQLKFDFFPSNTFLHLGPNPEINRVKVVLRAYLDREVPSSLVGSHEYEGEFYEGVLEKLGSELRLNVP